MKILMINYEYPPLGGGSSTATYQLAREFTKMKHEVLVVTSYFKGLPTFEASEGLKIWRIKCLRKKIDRSNPLEMTSFIFESLKMADSVINTFKPDKTLAFFTIPSGVIALYLKLRYRLPYIVSLRGGDVPGFQKKELIIFHTLFLPFIMCIWHFAGFVVANSMGLKNLAEKTGHLISKPISVINNGIDDKKFRPGKVTANRNKILFVGRLVQQKNIETLIRSIAMLKKRVKIKLMVEIVGDGPYRKKLMQIVSNLKLTQVITFSGWIDRKKIVQKYQSASFFVSPSLYEGMSNSILEAMACGMVVIATDIEGNHDLIKTNYNGMLFARGDSRSLTDSIRYLLSHEHFAGTLARNAVKTASGFRWKISAKKYYQLLLKI